MPVVLIPQRPAARSSSRPDHCGDSCRPAPASKSSFGDGCDGGLHGVGSVRHGERGSLFCCAPASACSSAWTAKGLAPGVPRNQRSPPRMPRVRIRRPEEPQQRRRPLPWRPGDRRPRVHDHRHVCPAGLVHGVGIRRDGDVQSGRRAHVGGARRPCRRLASRRQVEHVVINASNAGGAGSGFRRAWDCDGAARWHPHRYDSSRGSA